MWQSLSLRARLNLVVAAVLLIGVAANITRLLLEAGPRVQSEDQSVVRLAGDFARVLLAGLNERDVDDADVRVAQAFEGLDRLRHIKVAWEGGKPLPRSAEQSLEAAGDYRPPAWFVALVKPEQTSVRIPLTSRRSDLGALVISSEPSDEISEIWDSIVTQLIVGICIAIVLFLITAAVVSRALRPLRDMAAAMMRIETGDYAIRIIPEGPPELASTCRRLNSLVRSLGDAMEERRQWASRIVSLQDSERREVARELHDEFGPYLFALRAHISSLEISLGKLGASGEPLLQRCRAMTQQLGALQQVNRQILERLRPAGLADLGLVEALHGLATMWHQARPNVSIEVSTPSLVEPLDETVELSIYRVVQEALTNAFRHADASKVVVSVARLATNAATPGWIRVEVRDNGGGLAPNHKSGFGTLGMHERVSALGGSISINSTPEGLAVEALLPSHPADRASWMVGKNSRSAGETIPEPARLIDAE